MPIFHRETTIRPELPAPGTTDLVESILAGYAYHLNVMPLDARMPDAGQLVRAIDVGPGLDRGTTSRFRSSSSTTELSGSPPSR